MATPAPLRERSSRNPSQLDDNITALERLLAHNRGAKIGWAHFGWDNTGERTVHQARRLLAQNQNLFLSIKIAGDNMGNQTQPLLGGSRIGSDWLALFTEYPDRFVIGVDQFHASPRFTRQRPRSAQGPRRSLDLLPSDLARQIGLDNARRIYNLN